MHLQTLALDPDTEEADRARTALLCAAEAVASAGADNIFEVLVLGAARALTVDMAFIGVQTDERRDAVRAIAVCDRGQVQPNFEYGLPGTPCESVMGQEFRYYAAGIQELFPHPLVKEVGSIGYAAIPLFDACGRSMGMMAVIDRKPLPDRALTESVLKIFSVRAAIELERRTVDEARRRSEESYRSIFEAAEDPLFVHDADSGAILDVNPKACEQYGYSREELLRADVGQLSSGIAPYTLEHAAALIAQARRAGPVRTEWHGRNKDGSLHWNEVYIKLVKIGGADRILAVTREITERKRAEEERIRLEGQLRQAQKMEAIGQLTGGIAHDFNNILTGTLGYLVMARERAAAFGDAKLIRYLERAEGSGERAKALIQEMLTFSRGQRGEPRSLQLGPQLAEAVKLLQSSVPSSVEIQTELASVPCVLVDPLHVEQVLMNLCINARDAMEGKGSLRIALRTADSGGCECSSCHQTVTGSFVELAVTDSGPGIPPPVLQRMFEPFFSTKEVGKGSGMGLAMVHGIVHEYGGHIRVETGSGTGTTIRIWLPAWFPARNTRDGLGEADTGDSSTGQVPPRLRGRLLLAEDEAAVREFMEDLLTSWGLQVVMAGDGAQACERFAADPEAFDLVVLDQTMPRLRGLEAAEQILKLRPDMPVILYSGHSEHLSEARIAAAGIRALARKPLDIPAFRRLLEGLLPNRPTV